MGKYVPIERSDYDSFELYEQAVWNAIATVWVGAFKDDPEYVLQKLSYESVQLYSLNKMYKYLVHFDEIKPIEELDEEIKNKLWDHAKYIYPPASAEFGKRICRAIWTLNNI